MGFWDIFKRNAGLGGMKAPEVPVPMTMPGYDFEDPSLNASYLRLKRVVTDGAVDDSAIKNIVQSIHQHTDADQSGTIKRMFENQVGPMSDKISARDMRIIRISTAHTLTKYREVLRLKRLFFDALDDAYSMFLSGTNNCPKYWNLLSEAITLYSQIDVIAHVEQVVLPEEAQCLFEMM